MDIEEIMPGSTYNAAMKGVIVRAGKWPAGRVDGPYWGAGMKAGGSGGWLYRVKLMPVSLR
jgi:hypothetical protein